MRLAIIGCGNMGKGLAELLGPFHQIDLCDHHRERTQEVAKKINGEVHENPVKAVENAQFIFLAIKPQNLKELAHHIVAHLRPNQVIISLLAGTTLTTLFHHFPNSTIARIMPNLAMISAAGVIGLVDSPNLSSELKGELNSLLSPLGLLYWLKENQIDALTSLTASGPAFIFALIEAMTEAGVAMGFQAKEAQELILQMLQGCVALLQKTDHHPAKLKWQIASPSGTTIAGLRVLEKENVRSGLIETFLAAHQRAKELALSHELKEKML